MKMVVPLRVSTTLRLRDHFYAQDHMFRRRAARVALCFGVRIHVVMASPSVMEKVVFLLEAVEGMADHTEGTVLRAVGVECGRSVGEGRLYMGDTLLSSANLHEMALHQMPRHHTT